MTQSVQEGFLISLALLCVVAAAAPTHANDSSSGVVRSHNFLGSSAHEIVNYLRDTTMPQNGVFTAGCQTSPSDDRERETYLLIVPLSVKPILVVLIGGGTAVANVADLSREGGRFVVEEALGGTWTYSRLESIANTLGKGKFSMISEYSDKFISQTYDSCPSFQ